ncbi:hypothetical protein QQP08_018421 [Theobroma cacao]|nr:hypothetical protein QQP08_018421 [Theobroma cacao]
MEKQAKESKPGVKFTRFTYLFSPHQSALNKKWQLQPWQADPRSSATPPQVTAHYIPLLSSKAQQSFSSTPNSALQPPPFNAHFPFELLIPKQRKKIQAWMNPMLVSSLSCFQAVVDALGSERALSIKQSHVISKTCMGRDLAGTEYRHIRFPLDYDTDIVTFKIRCVEDFNYLWKLGAGSAIGAAIIKYGSILFPEITRPNILQALIMISAPVIIAVLLLIKQSRLEQ